MVYIYFYFTKVVDLAQKKAEYYNSTGVDHTEYWEQVKYVHT